jgi:saccharopine dehydrogenase-like NADP-dependent oxidoreductase
VRIAVAGVGAVGARAARQLASTDEVTGLVIADPQPGRAGSVAASLGPVAEVASRSDGILERGCTAAVIAGPPGAHLALARRCLAAGMHVVSTSDAIDDVEAMLDLDHEAAERRLAVIAGAGFSPGLSCLLARHLAGLYDEALEVHVARSGHGGPACGRHRDRTLAGRAVEWRDGGVTEHRAGSGRELVWFPDPLGGLDTYRAAVPDPILLARALPSVERASARVAAPPLGRLAAGLRVRPRLGRRPADGGLGGFRVEVRGRRDGERRVAVYGAVDRPAVAAGTVAAVAVVAAVTGRVERFGAGGLGEMAEPVPLLTELARRGVKAAVFEGAGT